MTNKKVGDKLFSELFTLKSDVGNQILRQTTIGPTSKQIVFVMLKSTLRC